MISAVRRVKLEVHGLEASLRLHYETLKIDNPSSEVITAKLLGFLSLFPYPNHAYNAVVKINKLSHKMPRTVTQESMLL